MLGGIALATMLAASPGRAQLLNQFLPTDVYGTATEPAVTVVSRSRPEYDYSGIRAGGYVIRPRLLESFGYETNPLGRRNAKGSALIESNASLDASTENSRGSANAGVSVDDYRYLNLPNQSFTNYSARLGGTYNIGRDSATVLVSHENLTQTQRDLDVPQLNAPLAFAIDTIRTGYRAIFNRLTLTPTIEAARYSYNSGSAGNAVYDQSYRNRVILTPGIAAAYEFATRRSVVVVVRNTTAWYAHGTPTNPKRDFNDTSILGGIDYDLNGFFRIRALAGYESRSFSSNTFKTIQAPIAEISLIYNPTGLTTVTATLARRIQDSSDETTAGVTSLSGRVRVDHELRRNVILSATGGVVRNDYVNSGTQTLYTGGVAGTYLLNRYASATAMYDATARASTNYSTLNLNGLAGGTNYVDHRMLLQLRLSL